MLDSFQIFTKGGLILFQWSLMDAPKGSPVDELVKQCLLEERAGETEFTHVAGSSAYTLRWRTHNALGLVFVAVYQKILRLDYVDDLLDGCRAAFAKAYDCDTLLYPEFEETFTKMLRAAEHRSNERRAPKERAPKAFDAAKKAAKRNDASGAARGATGDDAFDDDSSRLSTDATHDAATDASVSRRDQNQNAFDMSKIRASLKSRSGGNKGSGSNLASRGEDDEKKKGDDDEKRPKKKEKTKRVWAGENAKGKTEGLDFSEGKPPGAGDEEVERVDISKPSRVDAEEEEEYSSEEEEEDAAATSSSERRSPSKPTKKPTLFSSLLENSLVRGVVGKSALARDDLAPVLEKLKTNFMNKNVAEDIAERLCESVAASLEGKKLASFSSLSSMIKAAMEEALTRILTPKRSVDVLRDVRAAKEAGRPYVITFVGVNGVGKSTNLSKVAYWLLQHDATVMIAACDTFRAGAVEQLRTHCKRLNVPLFERGYEKDPANVAAEAIKAASRQKCDVVLVDTAGRMQDNEPLMRALAKLINVNEPDLVLFVGEALVGNDAVDQLSKFNERLSDLSSNKHKTKLIDGIVLSKFDTIDDKVGAALSMVYVSGAPVMFVGCGQTYTDLKKLNVRSVVKMLLSK
jgi:signal recognition particle receptor subunit alpha